VSEYQITSWRELPSLVVAREGEDVVKVQLAPRLQVAIDEAAMRLGDTTSEEYLAGWTRGPWLAGDEEPAALAASVAADLEKRWSPAAIEVFLDQCGRTT
jgi:hypothetical protein